MDKKLKYSISQMTQMAMLVAISIVSLYIVPLISFFPAAPYLQYDAADVPVLIGTMFFGPGAGLLILGLVSVIQGITISASSGWVGIVMHFCASGTLVLVSGYLYRVFNIKLDAAKNVELKNKTIQILGLFTWALLYISLKTNYVVFIALVLCQLLFVIAIYVKKGKSLVICLVIGSISMAAIMVPLNLFLTVRFYGIPYEAVEKMLLPVIIPFNLLKAGLNSLVTVLIFFPLKNILTKYDLLKPPSCKLKK